MLPHVLCFHACAQVTNLYSNAPNMLNDDGKLLERIGDTYIITGDIFCNQHTNIAARSAAGCAIQVRVLLARGAHACQHTQGAGS